MTAVALTETEFVQTLAKAAGELRDPVRYEMVVGDGLVLAIFADGDYDEAKLVVDAETMAKLAAMRLGQRRDSETCEHEWSEPGQNLWGQIGSYCTNGCGSWRAGW